MITVDVVSEQFSEQDLLPGDIEFASMGIDAISDRFPSGNSKGLSSYLPKED